METRILDTHAHMSEESARLAADTIAANPAGLVCFAAGHTQRETLDRLVVLLQAARVDLSALRLVSLDEWVGYGVGDEGSCHAFIHAHFLTPLGIRPAQYYFFDGKAADLGQACRDADAFIDACGGIGLTILGIGLNGHLGFNEPGADPALRSHVTPLAQQSIDISGKYFGQQVPVTQGITLGLSDLFAARRIIVQCTGAHKAGVVRAMFARPEPSRDMPASLLRPLAQCTLMLDTDSAAGL